jgi:hypothetical protein
MSFMGITLNIIPNSWYTVTQNCSRAPAAGFFRLKEKETGLVKHKLAMG